MSRMLLVMVMVTHDDADDEAGAGRQFKYSSKEHLRRHAIGIDLC